MVEVTAIEVVQGETMLCGLLHKVTDKMGGIGESLYYHLEPSVRALETTAAGKLVLASTAIRAGIPQMIGNISATIAPYSNPVVDATGSTGKYVVGKGLKGVAKVVAGDSSAYDVMQEGLDIVKKNMYNYAAGAATTAQEKTTEAATQAMSNINSGIATVQEGIKEQATKGVQTGIDMVGDNVNKLAEMGDSYKGQAYTAAKVGIETVQKNADTYMKQGGEAASKGMASGIKMVQENSTTLRDQAIAFAKENQTAIAVVAGTAALLAVGYVSYAAYNQWVEKNNQKTEDNKKSMASKVSSEFNQLKEAREEVLATEKANIPNKFKELQDSLKDTNSIDMVRISQNMVYKYQKDQTIDPEDINKLQEMVVEKLQGANIPAEKMEKLQETSAKLMASVMMCDQITKDLERGRVSPSFAKKVVADREGSSQRSKSK